MTYRKSSGKSETLKFAECIYQYHLKRIDFWTNRQDNTNSQDEKEQYTEKIRRSVTRAVARGKQYLQVLAQEIPYLVHRERIKLEALENTLNKKF
jgi:hypothetical protein